MYRDYGTKYTPTYRHEYRLGYVYEIRDMVFQFPDTGVQLTRTCVHTGMVRLPFHPHTQHARMYTTEHDYVRKDTERCCNE